MELSGIGALGIYLTLAFVMPGLCYVLALLVCFPDETRRVASTLATQLGLGAIGGLLVTSVCFSIEIIVIRPVKLFSTYFPDLQVDRIASVEAAGKGSAYMQVLAGSAFMHFNIAVGFGLILIAYLVALILEHNACRRRLILAICLLAVAGANLVDASIVFHRAKCAIDSAVKIAVGRAESPAGGGSLRGTE